MKGRRTSAERAHLTATRMRRTLATPFRNTFLGRLWLRNNELNWAKFRQPRFGPVPAQAHAGAQTALGLPAAKARKARPGRPSIPVALARQPAEVLISPILWGLYFGTLRVKITIALRRERICDSCPPARHGTL